MMATELERVCWPLKPQEAVDNLKEVYDYFANSSGNIDENWLYAINAGIEGLKRLMGKA